MKISTNASENSTSTHLIDILWSGYFWSMTGCLTVVWTFFSFILFLIDFSFRLQGRLVHSGAVVLYKLIVLCSGVRLAVRGQEHLHRKGPRIIVANHQSHFDIVLMGALVSEPFKYISKKEHYNVPFMGWIMRMAQYFGIERDNPRQSMQILKQAGEALDHGFSIVVFPEGTRTPDGEIKDFKSGLFYLSIKKQIPVVPIRLDGFREVLPKHSLRFRPGRASVIIGEPVYPVAKTTRDKEKFAEEVRDIVLNLI